MMRRLLTAVAFLTRIPINPSKPFDGADVARASLFFPLVGCLAAVLQWLFTLMLNGLGVHAVLQALAATVLLMLLGGGLHQDGLADMADGFGGAFEREKVLHIMRDSTIGTYGSLALLLSLAIRITAMVLLIQQGALLVGLVAAAAVSRCSIILGWRLPYARDTGTGQAVTQLTGPTEVAGAIVFAVVVAFVCLGFHAFSVLLIAAITFLFMGWLCVRKIGGVTGDTLGATTEVTEVLLLATVATLVSAQAGGM